MKYVKIEYPDKTVHNALITDYNHSVDMDIDFVDYYDITEDKQLYAIVKEVDGVLYKDPTITDYTYDELSKNVIKKDLNELPEEIMNIKENTKDNSKYELEFEVYNTETGYFIASTIAEAFHLNKKFRTKKINNVICVPVTEEEIQRIEVISNQGIPALKHKMVNELNKDIQSQSEFTVYHLPDKEKYFAMEKICKNYDIGTGTHYINGELCREINYDDIKKIEEQSKNEEMSLKAKTTDLVFNKQTVEVYKNEEKNTCYIKDDVCKQNNIGKGHHYIDSNLYREVSIGELQQLENKNLEIKYKKLQLQKLIQKFTVYVDEYAERYFVDFPTSANLGIGRGTHFLGSVKCKEVTLKEIKDVVENSKYGTIEYEPEYIYLQFGKKQEIEPREKEEEETIVYKDKNNNNKLYVKKEDCLLYKIGDPNKFKYVNNQECYEISLIELTRIKKPSVRTVYLLPEVDFEIVKKEPYLVCNYNDSKFIAKEIAHKFYIDYTNTITVDNKKFVEVKEEDLNKIDLIRKDVNIKPNEEALRLKKYNDLKELIRKNPIKAKPYNEDKKNTELDNTKEEINKMVEAFDDNSIYNDNNKTK